MAVRLAEALVTVHRRFDDAGLPHAFGGAIALAFCLSEPRATMDIDVNVFVGVGRSNEVLGALPDGVEVREVDREVLTSDGQVRVWWDAIPIDLFLSNHWFHGLAEAAVRRVAFAELTDLPVLACEHLAVFKTFFGRPKHAVDVANMVVSGTIDLDQLRATADRVLGDERKDFLQQVERFTERLVAPDTWSGSGTVRPPT